MWEEKQHQTTKGNQSLGKEKKLNQNNQVQDSRVAVLIIIVIVLEFLLQECLTG